MAGIYTERFEMVRTMVHNQYSPNLAHLYFSLEIRVAVSLIVTALSLTTIVTGLLPRLISIPGIFCS
jgi:cytochrome bd-type quinol oxidase subunit 1